MNRKLYPGASRKRCSHCKDVKDVSEFHRNSRTGDGLQRWCKTCTRDFSLKQVDKLKDKLVFARAVLRRIAQVDISGKQPDILWLVNWRNGTKRAADEALEYIEAK